MQCYTIKLDTKKKRNTKSPEILTSRKDLITNYYSDRIVKEQYPPLLTKYPTGYQPIFNDTHYPNKTEEYLNYSTYNSCTEINDDLNKPNVKKDEYMDYDYKDDNSKALKSDEIVINKIKEE